MKSLTPVLAILAAAFLMAASPAHAVSVGFDPATQTVALGDMFSVDVVVSDLGGEIVSAYDMDVTYDASILSAVSVSFGALLGDPAAFEVFEDTDLSTEGLVDFAQLSLLSDSDLAALQPDSFVLATIEFQAISLGTSPLEFIFDSVNDIKGMGGQILPVDPKPGSGSVVPEPQAALMFAIGACVFALRLRTWPQRSDAHS